MKSYLLSFFKLLFPSTCNTCNNSLFKHEKLICGKCRKSFPRTYFNMVATNPAEQSLWGRIEVEKVNCFLFYRKDGITQKLLHELKYKGQKELGYELGNLFAEELNETNSLNNIDVIIPVPLHPKKEYTRGYNQSEWIAKGIAHQINVKIDTNTLLKTSNNTTQTKKNRFNRFMATKSLFAINDKQILENKHILLVDDVLTTGATIEACYNALAETPNIKISVLTIGYSVQ